MTKTNRQVTIIESPFSAPTREGIVRNVYYAMLAVLDSLGRGEAPYASHLFFTQMLDDNVPHERELGIDAGLEISRLAATAAVYVDFGISRGMENGVAAAREAGRDIVERRLFDAESSTSKLEQLLKLEVAKHNLPDYETIASIYARIIK
ncbi:MAG: hypothetical protein ABI220_04340 [Candidatus Saccharimonadales bacterium]